TGPATARSGATVPGPGSQSAVAPPGAGPGVHPCANRAAQVPNDPYSPPCLTFTGDNGGATSRGVTATDIVVSARIGGLPDFSQAPSDKGPAATFRVDAEEIQRTMAGLADYFNSRFQLYGRQLRLAFFEGKGNFTNEIQGGGQEEVEADAISVADEMKAFAELNAFTAPFGDALARRGVVNFGAPYMSQEWMAERRPYVWSVATDCTFIQQSVTDYRLKRLTGRPAAHAGGALQGKPRTFAVIAPENPWYQQCVEAGERVARAAGNPTQANIKYKLDFGTLSNQAASVIAKLRSENITTVLCGCDPAFPVFLTAKAEEQAYQPEWIVTGAALVDIDVLGQLYQQDQWARAFGVSFLGPMQPLRSTLGYAAFKVMRPEEEPSPLVDILYYQMYLLALGVHMAGPGLTPDSFEAGMLAYPGGSGLAGTWDFTPGRYTPTVDAREIYWDPERTSPQNGEKGAYVETAPGKRYRPGQWPAGDPAVFAP
ncbi:MAG: ABC transporter substrate-binding protein, partial [Acidimicrobiia bacterium]